MGKFPYDSILRISVPLIATCGLGVSIFSICYQLQFVKWLKEEIHAKDSPYSTDPFEAFYELSLTYITFKAITLLVNLLLVISFVLKNQYMAITWLAWGIIDVLFMLTLLLFCISEWKLQHRYLVGILAWSVIKIFFIFVVCAYIALLRKEPSAQDMKWNSGLGYTSQYALPQETTQADEKIPLHAQYQTKLV